MLSINVLLQPHVFNSSFYFLSLVRAKKKGKKIIPIFIQNLRVRVIYECVLYSNKYGIPHVFHISSHTDLDNREYITLIMLCLLALTRPTIRPGLAGTVPVQTSVPVPRPG